MNHLQANIPNRHFNMATYQYALMNCLGGPELEERGAKYRTWDFAHLIFDSNAPILFTFKDRKINARYAVEEFLWYCRGNRHDNTIEQYANAWKKLTQEDGSYFSNYGHYIFAKMGEDGVSMFQFAAEELLRNASSRRAAIPLLETKHCFHSNVDMVCTFAIQFFVRNGQLDMGVNMRSNDAIWGLTNDAFAFCMLHRLMHACLVHGVFGAAYPTLRLGSYHHTANTLHVYERHYDMAKAIVDDDVSRVPLVEIPMFTAFEANELLNRSVTDLQAWTSFLNSSPA